MVPPWPQSQAPAAAQPGGGRENQPDTSRGSKSRQGSFAPQTTSQGPSGPIASNVTALFPRAQLWRYGGTYETHLPSRVPHKAKPISRSPGTQEPGPASPAAPPPTPPPPPVTAPAAPAAPPPMTAPSWAIRSSSGRVPQPRIAPTIATSTAPGRARPPPSSSVAFVTVPTTRLEVLLFILGRHR